jgi:hypothetical protein
MSPCKRWFSVQHCPFLINYSRLGHSRPLYNGEEFSGLGGNWVDGTADQGTGKNLVDGNRHLAKVGVAGSNPVFRSKNARSEALPRPSLRCSQFGKVDYQARKSEKLVRATPGSPSVTSFPEG